MSASATRTRAGWLAAEFVVVVLGVAMGLAVDAWREGRDDVAQEIAYLERLKANLVADTAAYANAQRVNGARHPMIDAFLAVVAGEESVPEDPLDLARSLSAALHADFAPPRRDTYDELISQGDLGRVSSAPVRQALADYYHRIEESEGAQHVEWKETATRVEFALIEGLPWDVYRWMQAAGTADDQVVRSQEEIAVPPPSPDAIRRMLQGVRTNDGLRNLLFRQAQILQRLEDSQSFLATMAGGLLEELDRETARLRAR